MGDFVHNFEKSIAVILGHKRRGNHTALIVCTLSVATLVVGLSFTSMMYFHIYIVDVYSGDQDFICNYFGGRNWTLTLNWSGKSDFNKATEKTWSVGGQPVSSS